MDPAQIKMMFNSTQLRVKVGFTRADCLSQEEPPPSIIENAKIKMEALRKKGMISFCVVYERKFKNIWKAFREAKNEPETRQISVTIAAGAPNIAGIKVEEHDDPTRLAKLTIEAPPNVISTWRPEWFELNVEKGLRTAEILGRANPAQLYAAFLKAASGETVKNLPLSPMTTWLEKILQEKKPYIISVHKNRREIIITIPDIKPFRDQELFNSLIQSLVDTVKRIFVEQKLQYKLIKGSILSVINEALQGPEIIGFDSPIICLGAFAPLVSGQAKSESRASAARPARTLESYPGKGLLEVLVNEDKMEAKIVNFNIQCYAGLNFIPNKQWLEREIIRLGLTVKTENDVLITQILESMAQRQDLNGQLLVAGLKSTSGEKPKLHASYKDSSITQGSIENIDTVDLRELQQRIIVRCGQLVAEIKYDTPPKIGFDVYGTEIPPTKGEDLTVEIGEGIEEKKPGKYFATIDGLPVIDGNKISCNKAYVHQGDVNLRTGNIYFDGPVEIQGSIDSGAVVQVTGDLIVHGTIRSGHLKTGGNLQVDGGIVTGGIGRIQTKGDVTADFIENSHITCGGNITVRKAILNCDIVSGGNIETAAEGSNCLIAGGSISCAEFIKTNNLGFKNGAITELNVGVDWKIETAIRINTHRFDMVNRRQVEDKQALRELAAKKRAQMTQRHEQLKENLKERLQKERIILEKIQAKLEALKAKLTYNGEARIYVKDLLSVNCRVSLGGQKIPLPQDVAGVVLTAKRKRGSHIVSLEEFEMKEKAG